VPHPFALFLAKGWEATVLDERSMFYKSAGWCRRRPQELKPLIIPASSARLNSLLKNSTFQASALKISPGG
jgi:hypothetical protein